MEHAIKIIVISDTHKNISNAIDIINSKKPDYVLHLGDLTEDADDLQMLFSNVKVVSVLGNCDWASMSNSPDERFFELGGVKIMMCHGHTYSVKQGTGAYLDAARKKGADIALFGHTHVPVFDNSQGVAMINPGSVATYGWINICEGTFTGGINRVEE